MINTLLGTKIGMTSTYDTRGRRVGATVAEIQPNLVSQIKTTDGKDKYDAVQLGYGTKKSVKKPQLGHGKKAGIERGIRWFREIRIKGEGERVKGEVEQIKPGTQIKVDQVFSIGDAVKVSGISKGRGFAGVVKRHGFHGGPKTHGQSDRLRAPGAIGSGTTPGRVYKGKKMAGHMGNATVSVRGLEVVGVDKEKNQLIIKGAVPGPTGGLIIVSKLGRIKGYTPPPPASVETSAGKEEKVEEEGEGESVKGEEVKSKESDEMIDKEQGNTETQNNEETQSQEAPKEETANAS